MIWFKLIVVVAEVFGLSIMPEAYPSLSTAFQWAPVVAASDVTASFSDIGWWNRDVGVIVGKAGFAAGTSDGGKSWRYLPTGSKADIVRIELLSADEVVAYTETGVLFSENKGNSWTSVPSSPKDMLVWASANTLLRGEGKTLHLSEDRGATWRVASTFKGPLLGIEAAGLDFWVALIQEEKAEECEDGSISLMISTNRGHSWSRSVSMREMYGFALGHFGNREQVCVMAEPGICCSSCECGCLPLAECVSAQGKTWELGELQVSVEEAKSGLSVSFGNVACMVSDGGLPKVPCIAGGKTGDWVSGTSSLSLPAEIKPLRLDWPERNTARLLAKKGNELCVYASENGGTTWALHGTVNPN